MISILSQAYRVKKIKGGRKSNLSVEDMLLMTLEYLREYGTYFQNFRSATQRLSLVKNIEEYPAKNPFKRVIPREIICIELLIASIIIV